MIEQQSLPVGTRVYLRSPSRLVTLQSKTGYIVRPDVWDGYYVVRLDQPALYHDSDGSIQELTEIREAADNMDRVPPHVSNGGHMMHQARE